MQTLTTSADSGATGNGEGEFALPETGFVRQKQVLRLVPFSKSTLWRRVKKKLFPQPIKLSVGITVWRVEDIRRWISQQR